MRRTSESAFDTNQAGVPQRGWWRDRGQLRATGLPPGSDRDPSSPHTHVHQLSEVRVAYSVEEAASLIGIGRTLAWTLVRSGELPSIRVAGRVLIRRRQLLEWLDTEPETAYPSAS
jgi:excisionase family DNA binding protein